MVLCRRFRRSFRVRLSNLFPSRSFLLKCGVVMSYENVLASAVSYWPSQEASGNLIDQRVGTVMTPVGSPVYAVAGPRSWLPRGVSLSATSGFSSALYSRMLGSVAYTIGAWVRRISVASGTQTVIWQASGVPQVGFNMPIGMFMSQSFAGAVSGPPLWSDASWQYASWRRTASPFLSITGRGGVFGSRTTVGAPLDADTWEIGGAFKFAFEFSGLAFWNTSLSDVSILQMIAGPGSTPVVSRRPRGSGRVREPR